MKLFGAMKRHHQVFMIQEFLPSVSLCGSSAVVPCDLPNKQWFCIELGTGLLGELIWGGPLSSSLGGGKVDKMGFCIVLL